MTRFLILVGHELRYYMTRISTHVYFGVFLLLAWFIGIVAAGAFPGAAVGLGGGQVDVNSPFAVFALVAATWLFGGAIIVAAISGNSVHRDYQSGMHPLTFTAPVSKALLLSTRFVGSILVSAWIFAAIPIGLAIAYAMPFVDREMVGPFRAASFLSPYLLIVVPNVVFCGAIFFGLAALTRQMLPNYLGSIALFLGYLMAGALAGDVEQKTLAALVDPFGLNAFGVLTEYWTPAERNGSLVPLAGLLLVNRLIWVGVGALVFAATCAAFKFRHVASERMEKRKARTEWEERSSEYHGAQARRQGLLDPPRSFGLGARLAQFSSVVRQSVGLIMRNVYFYAILFCAMLWLLLVAVMTLGKLFGTTTYPVTYQVIAVLGGNFGLFTMIVIVFYAGELVWEERERCIQQIHDALPIPNWIPFVAKTTALVAVVFVMHAALMLVAMGFQAASGYFKFEPLLYVESLFGLQLIDRILLIALVMAVHSLSPNKYAGHFAAIALIAGQIFLPQLGLEHLLFRYGQDPGTAYSDMNTHGPFLGPYFWFKLYWAGFAVLLAVVANLFWSRGQETSARWRLYLARQRFAGPSRLAALAGLALALGAGIFIFWNTNIRNEYQKRFEGEAVLARYERELGKHAALPQPRIVASSVEITLWPKEGRGKAEGVLTARNKTNAEIRELHVIIPSEADVGTLTTEPASRLASHDEELGYRIFELADPLAPGAELKLTYALSYAPDGFSHSGASTTIVENGTFINSGLLPSFGYSEDGELSDDDRRRKHDLPPKERMASVDDLHARRNTYIARDADWIDFEATVCTDPDQLAIAPGYLEKEFTRDDRRCFSYAMDAPILNFYSFLSARYVVERDTWHDVAIEVWHHPGHEYNVKRMIEATKKSLEYYTTHFTPYQHRQLRIVEFPRYATFAQSFPNTIPYSESIGFIARIKNPEEDIDYPFYVTAHEVAHQWFAHQVIGGNVQGSTLLSESLSQYAALKVMEQEFGRSTLVKFLKYERDQYLGGRSVERKKELPLLLVENQQYIHYNKGSVVLYALSDYIGEERFNAAIKRYLERVRFQEPPYTTSLELLAELRAVTPPELQYLLDDMLASITLYDLRTVSATREKLADGRWKVTMEIDAKKLRADEGGNEADVPMNDLVDVGAFLQGPGGQLQHLKPLAVERMRLVSGKQTVTLMTDEMPEKAGVNHRLLLIDRNQSDDIIKVEDAKPPAS